MSDKRTYRWQSPSNIALVKYWGKKGVQLPANASISFTLDACHTDTKLTVKPSEGSPQLAVLVGGKVNDAFKPKIQQFIERASSRYPVLSALDLTIETSNTFPHSSGIASSASGMSALALCLCSYLRDMEQLQGDFMQEASILARLGSGSACRSVFGDLAIWGEHEDVQWSSDEYAVPFSEADGVFDDYRDTILLVHKGAKSVSSTVGHGLLDGHPFAEKRYSLAKTNLSALLGALERGDLAQFIEIVEDEALMLHALMMTSSPSFILMEPGTLAIIKKIRQFREQNSVPVAFTLDAGANVHVLYPGKYEEQVLNFVDKELVSYCEGGSYLCDTVGKGPKELTC